MSKQNTETQSMTLNVDFENGQKVTFDITYPKDHGLSVAMAIHRLGTGEGIMGLLQALSDDPSVAKRLDEMSVGFDDDDEEGDL